MQRMNLRLITILPGLSLTVSVRSIGHGCGATTPVSHNQGCSTAWSSTLQTACHNVGKRPERPVSGVSQLP